MTKGQKTALGVVAIGGIAVAGYFIYKNSQKNKRPIGIPGQMPVYNAQMPPNFQAQPQQRPVLDFFTGLIGSGKVAKGIENIKGVFGKGSGGSSPAGPMTEAQYNASQSGYSGPFRN